MYITEDCLLAGAGGPGSLRPAAGEARPGAAPGPRAALHWPPLEAHGEDSGKLLQSK